MRAPLVVTCQFCTTSHSPWCLIIQPAINHLRSISQVHVSTISLVKVKINNIIYLAYLAFSLAHHASLTSAKQRGKNLFPQPAGYPLPCEGALLTPAQLAVHQDPQVLFCKTAV